MNHVAEQIKLKQSLKNTVYVTIKEALAILATGTKKIKAKQTETTNLQLNHEITMAEIRKCNKILKEIT